MSKVSRQQRAAHARIGSVAANPRISITDETADRDDVHYSDDTLPSVYVSPAGSFTLEELETMPLTIGNASTRRVQVWRGPDGTWYRCGAWLRIQPARDGSGTQFRILLSKGANRDDLQQMLDVVQLARSGALECRWEQRDREWASWADDRTFTYAFTSRSYRDPYTHADRSPSVKACEDDWCAERWHENGVFHRLDGVTRKLPDRRGQYSVSVTRAPGDDWQVDVFTDEFFGTPEDVASFTSDLAWMAEDCRRANTARARKAAA